MKSLPELKAIIESASKRPWEPGGSLGPERELKGTAAFSQAFSPDQAARLIECVELAMGALSGLGCIADWCEDGRACDRCEALAAMEKLLEVKP